ncbi:hypothetical protein [Aureliella helgolandensis]|uniref:Uncharacterized protein n=1 Tax=Aureliella helgolandensis TaxID=2527968 RepID=A0A518GCD5_9BACT|nr:hypothetical protein [Aureliella helgolandensis]QDV26261.1 hypothetical protein Q31a_46330 [Aureliella helgolandensis]
MLELPFYEGAILYSEVTNTGMKTYEIRQLDNDGNLLLDTKVEAASGEAAAKLLADADERTQRILICLDGETMNELDVEHWRKRIRRR